MRNRWFHVPLLDTPLGEMVKRVTWLELFYDLMFVAAFIELGGALAEDVTLHGALLFVVHFVPFWMVWSGFAFFSNRFDVDDAVHRGLVFAQMVTVGWMAIGASPAMHGDPGEFAAAFAAAQGALAVMYFRVWRQVPDARAYCALWGKVSLATALLFFASVFVATSTAYVLWALGVALLLGAPLSRHSRDVIERYPTDFEHLAERYGLLTIIVLGESFVEVLAYLVSDAATTEQMVHGMFNIFMTCAVWWLYFDDIAGSELKRKRGAGPIWYYAHLPLTGAITVLGVGVKKTIGFGGDLPGAEPYRWLLAGSLAVVLLSVAVIDSVTARGGAQLSDRMRVNARALAAFVLLLLAGVGGDMSGTTFLLLVAAILVGQVVFDLVFSPFEEGGRASTSEEGAASAHRKRDGRLVDTSRPRRGARPAIVRGAPSGLRRDLYFYFIDSSWTQLLLTLACLFALVIFVFAGLLLLEPGSITHGDDTLGDALAFSVQTLSTIGYGTLSPATPWANFIVTLEAAAGMLFVALATGVTLAKAARPQAGVLFSRCAVINDRDGQAVLAFRAGNTRGNEVLDAEVTVTVMLDESTAEGEPMRRLYDLELVRDRSPMFDLTWTVMHEIDASSPLANIDWAAPGGQLAGIAITLVGHDRSYAQTTYARHVYYPEDLRPGRRFASVTTVLDDGRFVLDYARFHDTEPVAADEPSGSA